MKAQKQTVTMPQSKPKNKLLSRIFAITFALIILVFMCRGTAPPGIQIILVGLLVETWKPSLDFTFHRDRSWIFMSIILFAVFVFNSIHWWIACGLVDWLPQWGWQATIVEYFTCSFAMETSSLSLMFGIIFLTKSVPQKSLSYKIILIGTVFLELLCFSAYPTAIAGLEVPEQYKDFWGFTIFQPWLWMDLTSEIVIFIGAVRLLRRAMSIKKLFLIIFIFVTVIFVLGGLYH